MSFYDLPPDQKGLIDRRVREARAHQRRHYIAEVEALRAEMHRDLAQARAEFDAEVATLRDELYRLREWHARANNELAEVQRMRAFTAFQMAQRDDGTPLQ